MQKEILFFKDDAVLKIMSDRIIREIISSNGNKIHNLQEKLSHLHLNPSFTFPAVALMEPAGSYNGENEKRWYAEKIREYLQQQLSSGNVLFKDVRGNVGLLFSWISKDSIEEIQSLLKEKFSFPINIGVGKPCNQLSSTHESYQQANQALQNKFYRGTGEIIYFSEIDNYTPFEEYPMDEEDELFNCIKISINSDDISKSVDSFYHSILQKGLIDIDDMLELTIRLLVGIENRVLSELDHLNLYKRYEVMAVVKLDTFQEIKQYVKEYFITLSSALHQNDKASHRNIIKKTIHFMELECQHATLNSVAEKVYMTPTYLSSLFKMNTGKTFIEQLTDIRMNKAKDMLRSTYLRNYEVAEKVGYQDSRYFSQIFKKKVGVSPSVYRESVGR